MHKVSAMENYNILQNTERGGLHIFYRIRTEYTFMMIIYWI